MIGEFFPFSDFPMYSNLGPYAHVLRVEGKPGEIVPLKAAFGVRESVCKKIWKTKLREIANAAGHDSSEATPDEWRAAGVYLVEKLMDERPPGRLESYGSGPFQLVLHEIRISEDRGRVEESLPIAELHLTP